VILGVVGDSAAGKTTLTRGLVRVLGEENVSHICTDDYHRYDRKERADLAITPLHPDCNYMDIIAQHLVHLRAGEAILKPVYRHSDGTFGPPVYVQPARFMVIEGLFGYYLPEMRDSYDVRVYLNPPEELRRSWKVQRDCSRRGYTTDQVLADLDRREPDSAAHIRPQRQFADLLVSFIPAGDVNDPTHLDAELTLRDGLPHPDMTAFVEEDGLTLDESGPVEAQRFLGFHPRLEARLHPGQLGQPLHGYAGLHEQGLDSDVKRVEAGVAPHSRVGLTPHFGRHPVDGDPHHGSIRSGGDQRSHALGDVVGA